MKIISKKTKKYNIDVESFRLLPIRGHVYWKDIHGYYLGSNDLMMEKCKVSSYKDLLTKTDLDFDMDERELYRQEDELVIQCGQTMQFFNSTTTHD